MIPGRSSVFRFAMIFILGMIVVGCGTNPPSTSDGGQPVRNKLAIQDPYVTLTLIARAERFASVQELEKLVGFEFMPLLDLPNYVQYQAVSDRSVWFKSFQVIANKEPNGERSIKQIEIAVGDMCIQEGRLANTWFSGAGIPSVKDLSNSNFDKGWVRNRNIPHLGHWLVWEYRPSSAHGIRYWLSSLGAEACANGFTFSYF